MKVLSFLVGGFFIFHVLCNILYFSPDNPLINSYQITVQSYMKPFFIQDWRFFVNLSDTYVTMVLKCKEGDSWYDPNARDLKKHYWTRFLHYGKKTYINKGVLKKLAIDINKYEKKCEGNCSSNYLSEIRNESSYKVAHKFALKECKKRNKFVEKENIKIAVLLRKLKKFSNRKKPYIFESAEYLELL